MPEEIVKRKRGRPPKNKTDTTTTISENNSLSSPTLQPTSYEFNAYSSSNILMSNYYFGFNIFDMYSQKELENLVKDPMTNNEMLRSISRILYGMNGTFTNTVDYITAMPTLDRVIVPYGKNKKEKQKNSDLMDFTLNTIKDKEFIRDALFNGMIDGTVFYYFETEKMPSFQKSYDDYEVSRIVEINEFNDIGLNASLLSLPTDYCKIVGRKNNVPVVSFNLDYFTDCIDEDVQHKLRKYPKEIRNAYYDKESGKLNKNWIVLNPNNTIVHKIKSSLKEQWGRPLVLAAIKDILYSDYFTDTKRNVLDEINNRIVYQTFPEGKDKGKSALTEKQQTDQHNAIKGAVLNKNNRGGTSFFSVAAGTKLDKIELGNTDLFDEKNEGSLADTIALDLGVASSLLNGSGSGNYSSQQNNLELISAQVFQWIEQIQYELNKVILHNILKNSSNKVEVYYLPITHVNKKNMVGFAKELYLQGKGSISLWASACGIPSKIFFALLDQELEMGIEDKYPIHQTSNTLSKDDKKDNSKGGAPVIEDTTNPSSLQTKANDSNNTPKPSTE